MTARTLPISAKDVVRFTPASYGEAEDKPVYLIAIPRPTSIARCRRELEAAGAIRIGDQTLKNHLRDAVNATLAGDAHANAVEALDRLAEFQERQETGEAEKLSPEESGELAKVVIRVLELEQWATQHWPPYASAVAQQNYWWTMAQIMAAKHFIRGWENVLEVCGVCEGSGNNGTEGGCKGCEGRGTVALEFKANDGLVPTDLLERLPEGDILEIGVKALSLKRVSPERRKN